MSKIQSWTVKSRQCKRELYQIRCQHRARTFFKGAPQIKVLEASAKCQSARVLGAKCFVSPRSVKSRALEILDLIGRARLLYHRVWREHKPYKPSSHRLGKGARFTPRALHHSCLSKTQHKSSLLFSTRAPISTIYLEER